MMTMPFKAAGETIYLLHAEEWATADPERSHLGKSLWLSEIHGRDEGRTPPTDLTVEKNAGRIVRQLIADGLVSAVHDVSDGGLAIALAEMAMAGGIGAEVEWNEEYSRAAWWFGEDQGRYVVTVPDTQALNEALAKGTENDETASIGFRRIGRTGGDTLFGNLVAAMRAAHQSFFADWMEG
jgi:phosphoribosylformylglycinamidine synthase